MENSCRKWAASDSPAVVSMDSARGRRLLTPPIIIWSGGGKQMEPGSCQWCPVTGQEGVGTHWNMWGSIWAQNILLEWGWLRMQQVAQGHRESFLGDPKPPGHRSGQQGPDGMAGAGTTWLPEVPPNLSQPLILSIKRSVEVLKKWQSLFFFNIKR